MTPVEFRVAVTAGLGVLMTIAIPFGIWSFRTWKAMSDNQVKIAADLQKVSQSLYGVRGDNGVMGSLVAQTGALTAISRRVDCHDTMLEVHAKELARFRA